MKRMKTIIWHEFRRALPFFCLGIFASVILLALVRSYIETDLIRLDVSVLRYSTDYYSMVYTGFNYHVKTIIQMSYGYVMIGIILFAAIQFFDMRSGGTRNFISALPYSKKQIYFTKIGVGIVTITIPMLLFYVGLCVQYVSFYEQYVKIYLTHPLYAFLTSNDNLCYVAQQVVMYWLFMVSAYVIFVAIRAIANSPLIATIIGSIMIFLPKFLLYSTTYLVNGKIRTIFPEVINEISQVWIRTFMSEDRHGCENFIMTYNNFLWEKAVFMLLVALISVFIIYLATKKFDDARNDMIFASKRFNTVFIIGVGICTSFSVMLSFETRNPFALIIPGAFAGTLVWLFVRKYEGGK